MPGGRSEAVDSQPLLHFAREAALGLVILENADLAAPRLTLPLIVSVWMRRARVGTGTARRGLLALRSALLETSGLDAASEPVPLPVSDPAVATLSLAVYLHGLLQRAAHVADTSRRDIAERAAEALAG